MRPIKLVMSAFGPFREQVEIDFNGLKNKNIFMISGPTGAGKTVIFDAISFALYGEGSGNNRKNEELLISDYTTNGILTFVNFEFEINKTNYKLIRYPEQKNTEKKCVLYIENEQPITDILTVTEKIEEILGLSKDQFKQIVMLPQGEFNKFLTTNTKEKIEIFRKIFGTQLHHAIQEDFKNRASQLEQEYKFLNTRITELITTLAFPDYITDTAIAIEYAHEYLQTIANETIQRQACKEQAEDQLQTLYAEQSLIQNNNQLLLKLSQVNQELIKLQNKKVEMEQLELKINALDTIKEFSNDYIYIQKSTDEYNRMLYDLSEYEQLKLELTIELKNTQILFDDYELKVSKHDELKIKRRELEKLIPKITHSENLKEKLNKLTTLINEKEQQKTTITTKFEENKNQITQINETLKSFSYVELDKVKAEALKIQTLSKYNSLKTLYTDCKSYEAAIVEHKNMTTNYISKNKNFEKLKTDYEISEKIYYNEQAGILAMSLQNGISCPVCGSTAHPSPATVKTAITIPTKIQIDAMKKTLETARIENNELRDQLIELNTNLQVMLSNIELQLFLLKEPKYSNQTLNTIYDLVHSTHNECLEIDKTLDLLNTQMIEVKNKTLQLQTLTTHFTQYDKELITINQTLQQMAIKKTKIQTELNLLLNSDVPIFLEELQTKLDSINILLTTEQQLYEEYKENFTNITKQILTLDTQIQSQNDYLTTLKSKIDSQHEHLSKNLAEHHISEDIFETLLPELSFKDMWVTRLNQYTSQYTELSATAQELTKQLENITYMDLKVLVKKIHKGEYLKKYLDQQITDLIKDETSKKLLLSELESLHDKFKQLEKKYKLISEIGDIANGKNSFYISYETFVIGTYFEEIIDAANIRLKQLTANRFTLNRQKEIVKGRNNQGLELTVFDKYTHSTRDATTLSGGESFQASLSLALGLSDVIQTKSKGIKLDMMFIDEGFGTLDSETLGVAVDTLMELKQDERLIGIISHVEELKNKISTQLEVIPTNNGSSVKWLNI
ncbi:AAA family ATPase [Candidatus Epulonipiscium viviparus]|uniref:AAA family ATPase n=1 Tax=Candidatus Epulonipiscium viviparus TaxID=420336 RepID=UPI00273812C4|nr:AAA family ATPase [Candidatus Epulopiscium viviparus]